MLSRSVDGAITCSHCSSREHNPGFSGCGGYIVETWIRATLERGRNVVYYCGLLDGKWFRRVFLPELRRKYAARVSGCHHPHAKHPLTSKACAKFGEKSIECAVCTVRDIAAFCCELWIDKDEALRIKGCALWTSFSTRFDQLWQYGQTPEHNPTRRRSSCTRLVSRVKRLSMVRSTEEKHASMDMDFYGQFAHIRETLDYGYHKNYTHERQRLQDSIMREFLDDAITIITDSNGEVCTILAPSFAHF